MIEGFTAEVNQHNQWIAQVNEAIPYVLQAGHSLEKLAIQHLDIAAHVATLGLEEAARRNAVQGAHLFFLVRANK